VQGYFPQPPAKSSQSAVVLKAAEFLNYDGEHVLGQLFGVIVRNIVSPQPPIQKRAVQFH
jgi:hypothetical protein